MNVGIVTTWFERGASYVSKQYMNILKEKHNVFIYARSGEAYAINDENWDLPNVYWSKKIDSPFVSTIIDKKEFLNWIEKNRIETILFNEQRWWEPLVWCRQLGIKTIAYIDYYTEETIPLFSIYNLLICNTKKHFEAFKWHSGARFIPWGTNIELFSLANSNSNKEDNKIVFFHSAGMSPKRKGTDLLLEAIPLIDNSDFKVVIHTQKSLYDSFPDLRLLIDGLMASGKLEIIQQTVSAPGLYHLGDVYVYPSRLEGIGLTVAEAIACGLPVIVPDCGPMNEFVMEGVSSVVKVKRFFSRYDGYYWPQNEIDIRDLAFKMMIFIDQKSQIHVLRQHCRNYAIEYLDWNKNAAKLLQIIYDEGYNDDVATFKKIDFFERKGLKRYNKYFILFPFVFKFFKR